MGSQGTLQALAGVALTNTRALEPKRRHHRSLVRLIRCREWSRIPGEGAAALAAAQHAGADRERPGAHRVVHEASVFHGTNNEIARTTGHSP